MYRYKTFEEYETEIAVLEYTIQEAEEAFDSLIAENSNLISRIEELEKQLNNYSKK